MSGDVGFHVAGGSVRHLDGSSGKYVFQSGAFKFYIHFVYQFQEPFGYVRFDIIGPWRVKVCNHPRPSPFISLYFLVELLLVSVT